MHRLIHANQYLVLKCGTCNDGVNLLKYEASLLSYVSLTLSYQCIALKLETYLNTEHKFSIPSKLSW